MIMVNGDGLVFNFQLQKIKLRLSNSILEGNNLASSKSFNLF